MRFRRLGLLPLDLLFAGWAVGAALAVGAARGHGTATRDLLTSLLTAGFAYLAVLRAMSRLDVAGRWRDLFRAAGLYAGTTLLLAEAGAAAALAGGPTWERPLATLDAAIGAGRVAGAAEASPALLAVAIGAHLALRLLPLVAVVLWFRDRAAAHRAAAALIAGCAAAWVLHLAFPARAPEIVAGLPGLEDLVPAGRAAVAGAPWDGIARVLDGARRDLPDAFPSAGAAVAVVATLAARRLGRGWMAGVAFLGLAALAASVVLGRHWVADVVAGLSVGAGAWWIAGRAFADPGEDEG